MEPIKIESKPTQSREDAAALLSELELDNSGTELEIELRW